MQKPTNYDSVKVGGYTPVEVGGHTCVIKDVREQQTSTGRDMLVISIDFDAKDSQPNYFLEEYKDNDKPDKKWPHRGTKYIFCSDYNNPAESSKDFKAFLTSVERSNPGFTIPWGEVFGPQFKGKKVGAVYGLVESEYEGKVYTNPELRWFCEYDKVSSQRTPATKYLKGRSASSSAADPFTVITDDDIDMPF